MQWYHVWFFYHGRHQNLKKEHHGKNEPTGRNCIRNGVPSMVWNEGGVSDTQINNITPQTIIIASHLIYI